MFYRDNTTFGLSIEIANLSNLSGWPSQTKTFHLSCFTVTFKKFVILGIQNPQVAFPKSKQFMGWPKYNGDTSITQDNSQSILSVLPSSYQFLQIDVKKSKHDLKPSADYSYFYTKYLSRYMCHDLHSGYIVDSE